MESRGVIVTSGRERHALAAIRNLGKHGLRVACGESRSTKTGLFPMSFYSKYCCQRFTYPPYWSQPEGFVEAVIDFAMRVGSNYDVLMPIDGETLLISEHKERIQAEVPHLKIPVHSYDFVSLAHNKAKLMSLADKMGIPTPKTYALVTPGEIERVADTIDYPAVIKLPESGGSRGLGIARDRDELVTKYAATADEFCSRDGSLLPLVQEYIPGAGYGVSCLFSSGELKARFTHKRLRETSPMGGPSVLRVSDSRPDMEDHAVRLLQELRWHGVAMVEFKLDERDQTPKLLEINPRFWGSLSLAIHSGVEFPVLLYQIAQNADINPVLHYQLGVSARFLLGDIRSFTKNFRGASSKPKFIKDFFLRKSDTFDDFRLNDPIPALAQVLDRLSGRLSN